MAVRSRGNVTVTFNAVDITQYCDSAALNMTAERLDTTNLASTGKESIAGDTEYSIPLSGNWSATLDTALAPEIITTGTKRTAVIAFDSGASTVTYTWTSLAEIQDYSITGAVGDFIKWSGTLSLSGAPSSRGVA